MHISYGKGYSYTNNFINNSLFTCLVHSSFHHILLDIDKYLLELTNDTHPHVYMGSAYMDPRLERES